ncbi:MAG TPA: hypothetical protein PK712_05050, partial [Rectinema sp.]|nr:hypothetical protein [Rectinema sp.]
CPYFEPDEEAHVNHGRIGGFFDAGSLANLNDEQIRVLFKGSALDQKWISPKALRRNAAIIVKKA